MSKIGIVALSSAPGEAGGVDVYTRGLVNALADHKVEGNTYTVIVADSTLALWTYRKWPSHIHFTAVHSTAGPRTRVDLLRDMTRRVMGWTSMPRHGKEYVARQLDSLHLDLLHFPNTVIYPLSLHTPCVLTFFDMQHEYYPQFFTNDELGYRASTYRSSVELAAHLIVPSDYTRRTLHERYNVPLEKLSLIPVGISDTFGRSESAKIAYVRAKYQLPTEFIYYPANPWQHKNHARLMAALRLYREQHGECPPLVLSGRLRNERREAMSLAIAAGIESQVIDLAFVDPTDLPELYSAAMLMVFPSLFEGFGIPLIEAMACGCPIAAADATTVPEIVGDASILFDPFSAQAIADALYFLLDNAVLREELAQRGCERVERYRWKAIVPELVDVYHRAVMLK